MTEETEEAWYSVPKKLFNRLHDTDTGREALTIIRNLEEQLRKAQLEVRQGAMEKIAQKLNGEMKFQVVVRTPFDDDEVTAEASTLPLANLIAAMLRKDAVAEPMAFIVRPKS